LKVSCNSDGIDIAIKSIQNGGIVVFPTDTVYGIGCDPYKIKSVEKIYTIKKRESTKFFPILGFSKNELEKIVEFDHKSSILAEKLWPGAITLVLKIKDEKIRNNLGLQNKIGVRVPNDKCILKILKKCKLLIGTSANISGSTPFFDPQKCFENVSGYDVFVDGGKIPSKNESTVVEIENGELKIIREGNVTTEKIMELF